MEVVIFRNSGGAMLPPFHCILVLFFFPVNKISYLSERGKKCFMYNMSDMMARYEVSATRCQYLNFVFLLHGCYIQNIQ